MSFWGCGGDLEGVWEVKMSQASGVGLIGDDMGVVYLFFKYPLSSGIAFCVGTAGKVHDTYT